MDRYDIFASSRSVEHKEGSWVRYSDHKQAVKELVEALEERT